MKRVTQVTRLHLNKPQFMFSIPAQILAAVLLITALITCVLLRAGVDTSSPEYTVGAKGNTGVVMSLAGFLVYYGVQAFATTYPFALALGATRRAYVWGTALANALLAAFVAVLMLTLLGLELATDHWFAGVYVVDVRWLGSGNPLVLVGAAFTIAFLGTSVGGFFGGTWVRFGAKGPVITAFGLAVTIGALLIIFIPSMHEIIAALTAPMLIGVGLGIALVALLGTWWVMRRASVR